MSATPGWLVKALGPDASSRLEAAVKDAESHTSAELVVMVRNFSTPRGWLGLAVDARAVRRRAERLFVSQGLDRTSLRNAVLVFVSVRERAVVVLGDTGIHEKLGAATWEALVAEALTLARTRGPLEGLEVMVRHLGEVMGQHFPRAHDDVNELPDRPHIG